MTPRPFFDQTSWGTVLEAKGGEEALRHAALERLLSRYRKPIMLELRQRTRCGSDEAEELTHQFLHNCLRRDFLKNVDPTKGRFRSFIKRCIINFLRDLHREQAGRPQAISLNETDEQGRTLLDPPAPTARLENEMDVQWARQVVALSLDRLERECILARRGALFTHLKPLLQGDTPGQSYASLAESLTMNEGAVRTAAHRLRQRLGEIIEEEIKQTLASNEDWREELRYLLDLLGNHSL